MDEITTLTIIKEQQNNNTICGVMQARHPVPQQCREAKAGGLWRWRLVCHLAREQHGYCDLNSPDGTGSVNSWREMLQTCAQCLGGNSEWCLDWYQSNKARAYQREKGVCVPVLTPTSARPLTHGKSWASGSVYSSSKQWLNSGFIHLKLFWMSEYVLKRGWVDTVL